MAAHFKRRIGQPKGLLLPVLPARGAKETDGKAITLTRARPKIQSDMPDETALPRREVCLYVSSLQRVCRFEGPACLPEERRSIVEQQLKNRTTVVPDTPAKAAEPSPEELLERSNTVGSTDSTGVARASVSPMMSQSLAADNHVESKNYQLVSDLEDEWDDKLSIAATETTDKEDYNLETLLRDESTPMLQQGYYIKSRDLGLPRHIFPGDTIVGVVCAVIDPEVIFLHEHDNERIQELGMVLSKELSDPRIENLPRFREPPPPDTIVVARWSVDGKWYRAAVVDVKISEPYVHVFFVDYGNNEAVPLGELRPLTQSLATYPQAIYPVCVQGIVSPVGSYSMDKIIAAESVLLEKNQCQVEVKEVQEEGLLGEVFLLGEIGGQKKAVVEIYEELKIATAIRKRMIGTPKRKIRIPKYTMIPRVLLK